MTPANSSGLSTDGLAEADRTLAEPAVASQRPYATPNRSPVAHRPREGLTEDTTMAGVEACEQAFHDLAARLAGADEEHKRKASVDRSLTCRITDLNVVYSGQLRNGELQDIRVVERSDGQLRLTMSSDDLVRLVNSELNLVTAWATGRVRIEGRVFDLIKIRSLF
jgi:alkyl sulfatase BDS1-like metallo-beta-lactamase superfamily hydrolase